jgi:hypothetical protein
MRTRWRATGMHSIAPAMALLVGMSGRASAQDQFSPTVINPKGRLQWFGLEEIRFAFEFDYRGEIDDVDPSSGGPATRDVEHRFREIFEIDTRSFIGHPNLVELSAFGRFGLTQRDLDLDSSPGASGSLGETLLEYDVSALFLRKQEMPFTLYTRRTETDIERQFGGSLNSVIQEHGLRLQRRSEELPFNFTYFYRTQDEDDRAFDSTFNLKQHSVLIDGLINIGLLDGLNWNYEFTSVDQSGENRATQSFDRNELNLLHTLEFGERNNNTLRSSFRYYDETGDFNFNQLRVNEVLRFRPTPNLTHWYDFIGEWNERNGQAQNLLRGSANVRHQLFDSLSTLAQVGALQFELPDDNFTSNQYYGDLALDYTKRVPLGRFDAATTFRYSVVDDTERGVAIEVPDNLFTFGLNDRVTLSGQNIVPESIRVRDATGTILYSEGPDYTLEIFADRIEIVRRLGGNIVAGQTVRVDYTIGPEPASESDTLGWSVSARYTFQEGALRGLSAFVRYLEQNETRTSVQFLNDPDFMPVPEEDFDEVQYGLEYNRGKFDLRAEQRIRNSTIAPFESIRLEGTYTEDIGRDSQFVLNTFFDEIDNTDIDLTTRSTTVSGSLNTRLTQNLSGNVRLLYRHTSDNQDLSTDAFEQFLSLQWNYGQTTVFARVRNSMLEDNASDRMFTTIFVGLRREF